MGCGGGKRRGQTGPRQARIPEACDEPGIETNLCPFCSCGPGVLGCKPIYTEFPHSVNVPVTREVAGTEIQQGMCRRTS